MTSIYPGCPLGPDLLSCFSHRGSSLALEASLTLTPPPWLTADLFPALLDLLPLAWPDSAPTHHSARHERMPSMTRWPRALEPHGCGLRSWHCCFLAG